MPKLLLTSILLTLSFLGFLFIRERTLTGTVTSSDTGVPLQNVEVTLKHSARQTTTDADGRFTFLIPEGKSVLVFRKQGFVSREITVSQENELSVKLSPGSENITHSQVSQSTAADTTSLLSAEETAVADLAMTQKMAPPPVSGIHAAPRRSRDYGLKEALPDQPSAGFNTESYHAIQENIFLEATKNPLSTFSIDVDAASYSNIRRFINQGQHPPKDAVRIEEMVNYFTYDYPQPRGEHPFSLNTELSVCPWNPKHQLLHIGLQGKNIATGNLPPSNLVFLIDVSGSMDHPQGLPLVKSAFALLVDQLRPQDHVAIVVYAGAAGLVLPPTAGHEKTKIRDAISRLEAGGSTAGGEGIKLAYQTALQHFRKDGNNRVILATDGDFNVGVSSDGEMQRLIEEKRKTGVFLTVLGFGIGNYKDSKMETLADQGNGNYAYIDNLTEARKVFVNEFGGTLFTIAKDVKLQLEFNPTRVKAYRLIGYENRLMRHEEFNDDRKDAGELGSGHAVTALYEIIPAGSAEEVASTDKLKYQQNQINPEAYHSTELLTLKLRYKKPDGEVSKLLAHTVSSQTLSLAKTSDNFRFSAAVAQFGLILRESEFKGNASVENVINLATGAPGQDTEGYRIEFINLVKSSQFLQARR